jgi:hypothetical protein
MTRISSRHGIIEAEFCPTCGERTIPGNDWSQLGHTLRRIAIVLSFIAAVGSGGFFSFSSGSRSTEKPKPRQNPKFALSSPCPMAGDFVTLRFLGSTTTR